MAIFRRKPRFKTSGDPRDDQVLAELARHGIDFAQRRDFVHYLYCESEDGAQKMQQAAEAAGWTVRRTTQATGIIANRNDWAVNGDTVRQAREFFKPLAASVPGGEWDGWEAAAQPAV